MSEEIRSFWATEDLEEVFAEHPTPNDAEYDFLHKYLGAPEKTIRQWCKSKTITETKHLY